MEVKACKSCGLTKPLTEFRRSKKPSAYTAKVYVYYSPHCLDCYKNKTYVPIQWAGLPPHYDEMLQVWVKPCSRCKHEKPFSDFNRNKDGSPKSACKECMKA